MDPKVVGQVGILLGSLGAALQWLRAMKGFPEWAYYLLAGVATALGLYLGLAHTVVTDWQTFLLENWPIIVTLYGVVLGGNQIASNAAKGIVARGGNDKNPLIPLTDSK